MISQLRILIESQVFQFTGNYNVAKLISSAATELMENAYKYSITGGGRITVQYNCETKNFVITETNIADQQHIRDIQNILCLIYQEEPEEAYKIMMLRTSQNKKASRLGLAKIRYECNAQIQMDIQADTTSYAGPDTKMQSIELDQAKLISITAYTKLF